MHELSNDKSIFRCHTLRVIIGTIWLIAKQTVMIYLHNSSRKKSVIILELCILHFPISQND